MVSRKIYILFASFFTSMMALAQNPDVSDYQTFADHWEYVGITVSEPGCHFFGGAGTASYVSKFRK